MSTKRLKRVRQQLTWLLSSIYDYNNIFKINTENKIFFGKKYLSCTLNVKGSRVGSQSLFS